MPGRMFNSMEKQKMTNEQKTLLKDAVKIIRQAQKKITDINNPLYGQMDECIYTILDLIDDEQ